MDSLSDRLRSLGVQLGARHTRPPRKSFPVEDVVPGTLEETLHGHAFFVEVDYPEDTVHGSADLRLTHPWDRLGDWAGHPDLASADRKDLVFLDTETTGLAGGAGTLVFMVGVGRFIGERFRLRQYFLRDPAEELAMLTSLEAFLGEGPYLVTFNGKSFDLPLLNSRWITNGWETGWSPAGHIDLLHLARRIWRESLPSRALGELEVHVLGLARTEEEVPGWLIPQMYNDYLFSGDGRPMAGVFYHNAMDMLSMVTLLDRSACLLDDPMDGSRAAPPEKYAIAMLFEDLGKVGEAVTLYRSCLRESISRDQYLGILRRLSFIEKRRKNYDQAIVWWRRAVDEGEIYAFVELAKYFEHTALNLEKAREWTESALELIRESGDGGLASRQWQAELEHRHNRLLRKIGNSSAQKE